MTEKQGKNEAILRYIRVFDPRLIPEYLFERLRQSDPDWNKEAFYSMAELLQNDPAIFLWVAVDDAYKVRGFLFANAPELDSSLNVLAWCIDERYQKEGGANIRQALGMLKDIMREGNLKKITILTTRPKPYERYGFKPSKQVIMEYRDDGRDRKSAVRKQIENKG